MAYRSWNTAPLSLPYAPPSWPVPGASGKPSAGWEIQHTAANSFVLDEAGEEQILIDGEIGLTTFSWQHSLSDTIGIEVVLPYVAHRAGIWDDLIYDWHEWFGLPQGGRSKEEANLLRYRYEDAQGVRLDREEAISGVGDVRLLVSHVVPDKVPWSLTAELRAPTGKADRLTGSEGWGISLGGGISRARPLAGFETESYLAGGITWNEKGETPLADRVHPVLASFRAGTRWKVSSIFWLHLQLDGHTPIYDSNLESLGGYPLQLLAGLDAEISRQLTVKLQFAEDLNPSVSPDFATTIALDYQFLTD